MPVIQDAVALSIDTILFATDFSESSARAEVYAKALARRFHSTVQLAHVFDPSVVTSFEEAIIGLPPALREKNRGERLQRLQQSFAKSNVAATALMLQGHQPAKELLKAARERGVDLIIAGTESMTGIERWVIGSTAEQLIRNAPCPVLTVGPHAILPGAGPLTFQRILYATDYSAEAVKAAMFALAFAEDSGAKLTCCYIEHLETKSAVTRSFVHEHFKIALKRLVPISSYDWCTPEFVVAHGKTDEELLRIAQRIEADLIVLGARTSSFWLTHAGRGLTPSVLAKAMCPVLTVC